jgi:cytosine/adenosine deaminase-related metal-dependent hydrolase
MLAGGDEHNLLLANTSPMLESRASVWTLTARWVFPVDGPLLERGTISIAGERIVAVEPHGTRIADRDLGNVAILPGLVNAHTHLDLSGARGKVPPSAVFTDWLSAVIAYRRSRSPDEACADIRAGLAESLRAGTTLLADIAAEGRSWNELVAAPVRAVVFHELLGLSLDRAREAERAALQWLGSHAATPSCRPGLSPHAPYSFRAELLPTLAGAAKRITIHLAESAAEMELLQRQTGPFVSFLAERGVWDPSGLARSAEHIVQLTSGAEAVLCAHGNYLDPDTPIPPRGTIVYCPRTHATFGHPPHPFRQFLARGVRVALGTDSLASNPDLDLLAEARFLHANYPDVPGQVLLRMATLSGAEALGWADETGSLTPGKSADLVVVPLPDEAVSDPHALVLGSALPVSGVLFRGKWVQ